MIQNRSSHILKHEKRGEIMSLILNNNFNGQPYTLLNIYSIVNSLVWDKDGKRKRGRTVFY